MGTSIRISGFPFYVSATDVTEFLESFSGKGTVFAVKVRQSKSKEQNKKAFVVVQFTEAGVTEFILSSINQCLTYQAAELKAWMLDSDLVPGPRVLILSLEVTTMHLGCQTSDNHFTVFEEVAQVRANFGFGLKKLELLLTYCDIEYKLELSYDSISQVEERPPWNQDTVFIIIQLIAAPKIYEKRAYKNSYTFANYFKHTTDDEWMRTVDFTASSCIGLIRMSVWVATWTVISTLSTGIQSLSHLV